MTDRILDLSDSPAYLRVKHEQLVIEREEAEPVSLPLTELAVLILAHPQVTCTLAVLSVLMDKGGSVVVCGRDYLPNGLMLPTVGHSTQVERFAAQAAAPLPLRKRIWKQIVREKVRAQARLIEDLRGDDCGLLAMATTVRSGDPDNVEAQAARRYWAVLFDDPDFQRRFEAPDQNRLLNYGYAVLRAIVSRAICAAGLHPSLGLHHHNRYDAFCLADDLMEPYRPMVDAAVVEYVATYGKDRALDRQAKQALLSTVIGRYCCQGEERTLFDWIARTASSLVKVLLGEADEVFYPEAMDHARD